MATKEQSGGFLSNREVEVQLTAGAAEMVKSGASMSCYWLASATSVESVTVNSKVYFESCFLQLTLKLLLPQAQQSQEATFLKELIRATEIFFILSVSD